jgi:hypothetical protein
MPAVKSRGLCRICYFMPGSLDRFPSKQQLGYGQTAATKPCEPTDAMPGTPEKIEVLTQRARLGQLLWHVADRMDADQKPRSEAA